MVLQRVEAAPARVFRLNGIALDPAAADVIEKVLAGLAGGVQIREVEAVFFRRRNRLGKRRRPPWEEDQSPSHKHQAKKDEQGGFSSHGGLRKLEVVPE